jgi:serine/threonine protein kinase
MGVVYAAEQANPHRVVALKVLRFVDASAARLRRFEREAEILGRLHHPGIAQVYAVGRADAGRGAEPFIAMELVEGRPLSEHAAEATSRRAGEGLAARKRGPRRRARARARRGAPRPEAGEHPRDRRGNAEDPRLRDRARGSAGRGAGLAPDARRRPARHAAVHEPRAARRRPAAIDLRADVYALGVVGYELLAGRLPSSSRASALAEAARRILDEAPPSLGAVDRALRGDLATIFAKALEKDRERRYATAGRLADDLGRFLRHEPIEARDPSRVYQLSRFARRNRVLVGGVAAVFLALVLGIVGTTRQARRADEERNRALLAKADAE